MFKYLQIYRIHIQYMYISVYPLTHIQTCTIWFLLTVTIAYNSGYCLEKQMKFGGRMVGNFKKILLSKNDIIYAAKKDRAANTIYKCGLQSENKYRTLFYNSLPQKYTVSHSGAFLLHCFKFSYAVNLSLS